MSRLSAARGTARGVRRVKIEGEGVPWSVLITDVAPRAVRTIRRSMLLRRKRMNKESAVQFMSFVEALMKYAALPPSILGGIARAGSRLRLPPGNFFARAAGITPPAIPAVMQRAARRLSPENLAALQGVTTVGETVRPPVWL